MSQKKKMTHKKGAGLVEYAILLGLISVLSVGTVFELGKTTRSTFQGIETELVEIAQHEKEILPFVRATSETIIAENATEITVPITQGEEGDIVVAVVAYRNEPEIPPGWTLDTVQRAPEDSSSDVDQWIAVLSRPYTPDLTSVRIGQSSPERLLGHTYTIGGSNPCIASTATKNGTPSFTNPLTTADFKNAGDNILQIASFTDVHYRHTTNPVEMTPGWTLTTPKSRDNNRLFSAWRLSPMGSVGRIETMSLDSPSSSTNVRYASSVIQITNGCEIKNGPKDAGYPRAVVQIGEWEKLKRAVQPDDPTDTYIPNVQMQSAIFNGYTFIPSNYTSFDTTLETLSDGSGRFRYVSIIRVSYERSSFPAGEEIIKTIEPGGHMWLSFKDKPGQYYAMEITKEHYHSNQIKTGRQAIAVLDGTYMGTTYEGDPTKLRYEDGIWYKIPQSR